MATHFARHDPANSREPWRVVTIIFAILFATSFSTCGSEVHSVSTANNYPDIWVRELPVDHGDPEIVTKGEFDADHLTNGRHEVWIRDATVDRLEYGPNYDEMGWHRFEASGFFSARKVEGQWRYRRPPSSGIEVKFGGAEAVELDFLPSGLVSKESGLGSPVLARLLDGSTIVRGPQSVVSDRIPCEYFYESIRRVSSQGVIIWDKTILALTPPAAGPIQCRHEENHVPFDEETFRVGIIDDQTLLVVKRYFAVRLRVANGTADRERPDVHVVNTTDLIALKKTVIREQGFDGDALMIALDQARDPNDLFRASIRLKRVTDRLWSAMENAIRAQFFSK